MQIHVEELSFPGCDGDPIRATRFSPPPTDDPAPGILLVHEVYGSDMHMRELGARLAAEGFHVMLPDLYSRDGLPGPASSEADPAPVWDLETIRAAVAGLPDRRTLIDLDRALSTLGAAAAVDETRLAALGFCMGGTLAFLLGCTSNRVAAVVDFYGGPLYGELSANKPTQPLELVLNLDRPLLAFFGERDEHIPMEHVELLREKLTAGAKSFDLVTFPHAGHGFFNDRRPSYDAAAAADAWKQTLGFLHEVL